MKKSLLVIPTPLLLPGGICLLFYSSVSSWLNGRTLNIHGMMGYLEIPSIQVRLPTDHDVEEASLRREVWHIPRTHLPTGGQGHHSALAGHRAFTASQLFNNLDHLELGDVFYLYILKSRLIRQIRFSWSCRIKPARCTRQNTRIM